ncbi:MAG: hypothetical protein BWY66_01398 [bacterium ADurb.Bin374]|nr:MAG: hypothetical protein BWY66_01398 [bacterium ADurb.Bin374]
MPGQFIPVGHVRAVAECVLDEPLSGGPDMRLAQQISSADGFGHDLVRQEQSAVQLAEERRERAPKRLPERLRQPASVLVRGEHLEQALFGDPAGGKRDERQRVANEQASRITEFLFYPI